MPDVADRSDARRSRSIRRVHVETTPPPVGVPTADEAEARTRDLMTAVGLDPADFKLETYADQWYASVTATEQLDGQFAGRSLQHRVRRRGRAPVRRRPTRRAGTGRPVPAGRPRHRDRPPQRPERLLHGRLRRRDRARHGGRLARESRSQRLASTSPRRTSRRSPPEIDAAGDRRLQRFRRRAAAAVRQRRLSPRR